MNILITGAWSEAKNHIGFIKEMGHTVSFLQYEKDELPCNAEDIEYVICGRLFSYHPIELFTNLKNIQLTSAGYDHMPMEYIRNKGITLYNAKNVYSIPMAEYVLTGILNLYKKMNFFYENKKTHIWEKNREVQGVYGKKVCIVGCGDVGRECAKRFQAFGCSVSGIATSKREQEYFDVITTVDDFDSILEETDILAVAVSLNSDTYHLMNKNRFDKMKTGSILVNVARGQIVDTNALMDALNAHKLFGAVLDVFEEEPLSREHPLWDFDNVIITPHNSYMSERITGDLSKVILKNLIERN